MSKHETPLTEQFWKEVCNGAYLPEFMLVSRTSNQARRLADAVILTDRPHGRAQRSDYPNLNGENVVVVQTKAHRLGMNVMGQAVFSARLLKNLGANAVRSIILVTAEDAAMQNLLDDFPEVEVWIADPKLVEAPRRVH
ncbi:MAG: hypothetical protein ABJX32_06130 [Tateyamaria sp.]|uniref:hypothetical protein n=1 Tax=Tateyamaria sp. TaxID=1929288 RepID=UPI00329DDCC5